MTAARRLSVAPMMRHSHRHARILWRMLCPDAQLYTEMAPAGAVARGRGHAQQNSDDSGPVVLQLGGSDPADLAEASRRGEHMGFCAVNLNCGCPSAKVAKGGFGACMMAKPETAARAVAAMRKACSLPVTVKCRTAVDELDPDDCLTEFTRQVRDAGASAVIVHARKAWLGGLNPKQNRSRPPLEPERVVTLKRRFPDLEIVSNGGIGSFNDAVRRSEGVDGVMLGRAIVSRPTLLAEFAERWHGAARTPLGEIVGRYLDYCAKLYRDGEHPRRLLTPLAALAAGRSGARRFRRAICEASSSGATGAIEQVRLAWS